MTVCGLVGFPGTCEQYGEGHRARCPGELNAKYPQITNYTTTIWMENITHVTKQGTKEFGLQHKQALKDGDEFRGDGAENRFHQYRNIVSPLSKSGRRELIAAIMAAPDYKARFKDAVTL
ncbi:hypothetical protein [Hungatella sp.]|uniref:hypothetical protein n=1 Tax=Hungatella sp. TaxID=2613924 RepID=UPI003991A370